MQQPSRIAAGIVAVAIVVVAAVVGPGSDATVVPATGPLTGTHLIGAEAGAEWIAAQFNAQGFIPSPIDATQANPGITRQAALTLTVLGRHHATAEAAYDWLATHLDVATDADGHDLPGVLAELILVATALHHDATAVGGIGATHDLVARLEATRRTTGSDAGLFGNQSPLFDGAYRQGLALRALGAVGVSDAPAEEWLLAQQCADGSWMAYRPATDALCPAPDPVGFTGPDTNSTAAAVLGRAAVGTTPAHDPLPAFDAFEAAGGGWSYFGGPAPSDPNSTALVIDAIDASGADPSAARFTRGNVTAFDALLAFQLGCAAPADARGAFWFATNDDGTVSPDLMASIQAATALAIGGATTADAVINAICSDVTTTTSTTTTTTSAGPTTTTTTTALTTTSTTTTTTTPTEVLSVETARAATPVPAVVHYAG